MPAALVRTTPCAWSSENARSSTPAEIDWIHRRRGERGITFRRRGRSKFHADHASQLLDGVQIGRAAVDRVDEPDERPTVLHYRLDSIVQDSPDSPIFSNPARWYIIRERLWTATDSDNAWNPSSRAWTMQERSSA